MKTDEMQFLTLEQPVKLLGSDFRICQRCHKLFRRRPGISNIRWQLHHKICSVGCIAADTDHKNGKRQPSGQNLFRCNVCGIEIIGHKKMLKKHKYDVHAH